MRSPVSAITRANASGVPQFRRMTDKVNREVKRLGGEPSQRPRNGLVRTGGSYSFRLKTINRFSMKSSRRRILLRVLAPYDLALHCYVHPRWQNACRGYSHT